MIASGQGNTKSSFGDVSSGSGSTRYITAQIFKSWFSPTGPAEFVSNMSNIKEGISILYIAGSLDRIPQTKNREYAFAKAPLNNSNQFTVIESGHLDVPSKATEVVIEWLRTQ